MYGGNHLHQFHQRGGVKEMYAHAALGTLERRGYGRHRKGGGVGGDDGLPGYQGFELFEKTLFHIQVLDHRFDH